MFWDTINLCTSLIHQTLILKIQPVFVPFQFCLFFLNHSFLSHIMSCNHCCTCVHVLSAATQDAHTPVWLAMVDSPAPSSAHSSLRGFETLAYLLLYLCATLRPVLFLKPPFPLSEKLVFSSNITFLCRCVFLYQPTSF